MLAIFRISW